MAHSFSRIHIHLIFSTKDRRNIIAKEWQPRLWAYLAGICENQEMISLAVGGTENHVHVLLHVPPKIALAKAVVLLKANSYKWMDEHGKDFSWQEGYGAFSVSASNLDQVTRYIQNQEAHHRKTSFEDEFRALLRKHGVEYDPKYLVSRVSPLRGLTLLSEWFPTPSGVGYVLSPLSGLVPYGARTNTCTCVCRRKTRRPDATGASCFI